ncbi:phosphatase PAP2 family protein [Nocardia otitidiscaviarum]|uniref:phosphatase PAP2 family protein n=1 Tax=Nocardia otitidiscaviarum TaxID=1823 RepID=UPI00189333EA|nr:phosphatase PAP2 family protein [Nocardia otitidiscaviarum]MBF6238339.1 phosphatase PAP2 family protein [Nocardia otitidiscaviarum]
MLSIPEVDARPDRSAAVPLRRWPWIAAAGALVAVATYVLAVRTADGQALENAALRGADQAAARDATQASHTLDQLTVYSLAAAMVILGVIAVLRRRVDLMVAAFAVIVAGQAVVQPLKRFLLPRPELVSATADFTHNSFPSGHTTAAMTVLFALVLVVPYRWRGLAMLVALPWAVSIGHYTLTAKWHRLSDTLAADAIALALACLASWWLVRRGAVRRYNGRARVVSVVVTCLMSLAAAATLVLGAILWLVPIHRRGFEATVHGDEWVIYLGATSFAHAGSILAALVFLTAWHRLETAASS